MQQDQNKELADLKAEVAKTRQQISSLLIWGLGLGIMGVIGSSMLKASDLTIDRPFAEGVRQSLDLLCSFPGEGKPPEECRNRL